MMVAALGASSCVFAQERRGRMGINTATPDATLQVSRIDPSLLPAGQAQGVTFPNFTTAERTAFQNIPEGMMIYNTDKACLEIYLGNAEGWICADNRNASSSTNAQAVTIEPSGWEGIFAAGRALDVPRSRVKFTIKNNTFYPIPSFDTRPGFAIQGAGNVRLTVPSGYSYPYNAEIPAGSSREIIFYLEGTPQAGPLKATFAHGALSASQEFTVHSNFGIPTSKENMKDIFSFAHGAFDRQGKIDNGANKITVQIPYTQGHGTYTQQTITATTASGEGGDVNGLTLQIPAGTLNASGGTLTATITVDGDGVYHVKKLANNEAPYSIAEFPVDLGGMKFKVILRGIGGVVDRHFGDGTQKHDMIYIPIEGKDGKRWLNNNLGANYANIHHASFDPGKQAQTFDDYHAFGYFYQWQRPADGHEYALFRSRTDVTWVPVNTTQATTWQPNHGDYIHGNPWTSADYTTPLWGAGGANNPCPTGYHVPSRDEWQNFRSSVGTYYHFSTNNLKIPSAGYKSNGVYIYSQSGTTYGYYATSSIESPTSRTAYYLYSNYGGVSMTTQGYGSMITPIRCIQD